MAFGGNSSGKRLAAAYGHLSIRKVGTSIGDTEGGRDPTRESFEGAALKRGTSL